MELPTPLDEARASKATIVRSDCPKHSERMTRNRCEVEFRIEH